MNDLFSLQGRTALITGGSRGIGKMIAAGFVAHGARVYLCAWDIDACEQTAEEFRAQGAQCQAFAGDASTMAGIAAIAQAFRAEEGRLDILVNNAATTWAGKLEDFPESAWDKVMDLNVKAPFFLIKALLPELQAAATKDRPAKVINISSIDGIAIHAWESYPYFASKAGLIHLTRRLALQLIKDDIVVSTIAPGSFASNMNKQARDTPELAAREIPAMRIGRTEDMAGSAVFLASRAGDYMVGATLVVDGGRSFATIHD